MKMDGIQDRCFGHLERYRFEPLLEFYNERSLLDTINGDQSEIDVSSTIFNVLKAEVI